MAAEFTNDQFRSDFPEFTDIDKFPETSITFWANAGILQLNPRRWGAKYLLGLELYVAHNISLEAMDQASVNAGSLPGTGSGVISGQNAGVSVQIDTQASIEDKGGAMNLTTYGTRFLRLSRIVGIGGFQLW